MIQLKPTMSLKIEKMSANSICIRVTLWVLFYFTIIIMSSNGKKRYIDKHTVHSSCNYNNQSQSISCTLCSFLPARTQEFTLSMQQTMNQKTFFKKNGAQISKENPPVFQYTIVVGGSKIENQTNTCNNYTIAELFPPISDKIATTCTEYLNEKDESKFLTCYGLLNEIKTNGFQEIHLNLTLETHQFTDAVLLNKAQFEASFENPVFFDLLLQFQKIFLLLSAFAFYYMHSQLVDYPKQNWLTIHKWIQYLLLVVFCYNLPIQLTKEAFPQLYHMTSNLLELLIQTSLFYFWLDIYELQLNDTEDERKCQLTGWQISKFLLVTVYTMPQVLMNIYIFYEKETNLQFDWIKQFQFRNYYINLQLGGLLAYSLVYIYLMYISQCQKRVRAKQGTDYEQEQDIRQHDPFYEGQIIQQEVESVRNYTALHFLSLICFCTLIYCQRYRILDPTQLQTMGTINELALLNIYVFMVSQLHMPYQEPYEEEKGKNVYGDIELEEQGKQVDREKLWKNIQKQINEQVLGQSDEEL